MSKKSEILKYSTPSTVYRRAKNLFNDDVQIKLSTRNDKKYMLYNPQKDKWVHFGQMGYQDYTQHLDKKRRALFMLRNLKWASKDKYSPAYLSYTLLW